MADPLQHVERELAGERANALAMAVEALERALGELAEAAPRLRADRLAEARDRLWCLVVLREAIGLHRHETLYETLRVPAEVRLYMAPRLPR